MDLIDLLIISLRTLAKNKLRSGLTVLGVVIGIASVTTMVSIGQGATQLVNNEFESIGSNVIVVFPGSGEQGGARQGPVTTLTEADAQALGITPPSGMGVDGYVGFNTSDTYSFNPSSTPSGQYDFVALAEHEMAERIRRRIERHLAEARLPPGKTLDTFDFEAVPVVSKAQVMALAAGDAWLNQAANLLVFGPPALAS